MVAFLFISFSHHSKVNNFRQVYHTIIRSLSLSPSLLSCVSVKEKSDSAKELSLVMGSGAGNFIKVLLRNFDVLAGPVVSLVYPLYASVQAIETQSHADDKQWLTYWVLYSLLTLFELTFAKLIEWLPIWSYTKLILTCWLVIPYFSGAAYVYEHVVRPVFVNPQSINIWYVPKKMDIFRKPDDVLTAAEKYIAENGPDAFEKILSKAHKSRRYVHEDYETMSGGEGFQY